MLKRNDLILLLAVLLLAALGYGAMRMFAPPAAPAARAVALLEGQAVLTISLAQPGVYRVPQAGDAVNVLTVEAGAVRMTEANCPDGWCMKKGAVSRAADQIVCLPHKLIIQLEGEVAPSVDDLDVIVQ